MLPFADRADISAIANLEYSGVTQVVLGFRQWKGMEEMLGVKDPAPAICRIFRYKRAIPQYGVSTKERLEAIGRIEGRYPGLYLAGAIRDGIGMADRISQAKTIAGDVAGKILIIAPAFIADCLETIIELGVEYRELFIGAGGSRLDYVESLNDMPEWIEVLRDIVRG